MLMDEVRDIEIQSAVIIVAVMTTPARAEIGRFIVLRAMTQKGNRLRSCVKRTIGWGDWIDFSCANSRASICMRD